VAALKSRVPWGKLGLLISLNKKVVEPIRLHPLRQAPDRRKDKGFPYAFSQDPTVNLWNWRAGASYRQAALLLFFHPSFEII
jgi:hypothetical protein